MTEKKRTAELVDVETQEVTHVLLPRKQSERNKFVKVFTEKLREASKDADFGSIPVSFFALVANNINYDNLLEIDIESAKKSLGVSRPTIDRYFKICQSVGFLLKTGKTGITAKFHVNPCYIFCGVPKRKARLTKKINQLALQYN